MPTRTREKPRGKTLDTVDRSRPERRASQFHLPARTRIGWQGIRFTLPPDWNLTSLSMNPADGYLKVDSPGRMCVQVRWIDPGAERPKTLAGLLFRWLGGSLALPFWIRYCPVSQPKPDIGATLDRFLRSPRVRSAKVNASFDSRVRPECEDVVNNRLSRSFSWSGIARAGSDAASRGHGKIWHCRNCGRIVMAQVVGGPRDPIEEVGSHMFNNFACHSDDGWTEWALYELSAFVPDGFRLVEQKVLSGYLRLGFRRGGERILIERWGLANVARKRFTLAEWLSHACHLDSRGLEIAKIDVAGDEGCRVYGRVRGIQNWAQALRNSGLHRPATRYEGCAWECPETNRLFAIQSWSSPRSPSFIKELTERCTCHPGKPQAHG